MSNKNQETIADIVDAMRNEGHTGEASCLEWIRAKMTYYADRIEAAEKRERAAGAEAAQICGDIGEMVGRELSKNQSVTNCNRLGNAARMREALSNACYAMFNFLKTKYGGFEEMAKALDKAKSALAEPPRNCDRFETAEDAYNACPQFCDIDVKTMTERELEIIEATIKCLDWLFAPATEQKGDNNGSK